MFFPHHLFLSFTEDDELEYFGAWQLYHPRRNLAFHELEMCVELAFFVFPLPTPGVSRVLAENIQLFTKV